MSEREGFLQAICAEPEDDTRRLAFADWLDEQGEAERAEFVRVQCELANGVPWEDDAPWYLLAQREREMLSGAAVVVPGWHLSNATTRQLTCGTTGADGYVSRGFVARIELPCAAFLEHAAAIFRAHPVTTVTIPGKVASHRFVDQVADRGDEWGWCMTANRHSYETDPFFVPDALRGHWPDTGRLWAAYWVVFDTEAEAVAGLSHALVSLGRHRAGLPPLRIAPSAPVTSAPLE